MNILPDDKVFDFVLLFLLFFFFFFAVDGLRVILTQSSVCRVPPSSLCLHPSSVLADRAFSRLGQAWSMSVCGGMVEERG